MKINFTYNKNEYTLCTIKDFAKTLAEYLENTKKPRQTRFVADFALSNIFDNDEVDMSHPELIVCESDGWYGVKELGEIGFNSDNKQLAFDYYGGNNLRVFDYNESYMHQDDAERNIKEIIKDIFDVSNDATLILVQWTEDECLVHDEKEAIKPIEDEAVTNFAEILCDYVSGLDEGEGIGREDIITHLYAYINWNKRFTREFEEGKKNFKPF